MLFASGVGFWVLMSSLFNNASFFTDGEGILSALLLMWLGGLVLPVVFRLVREKPGALATALLAATATLALALALVALDSATYAATVNPGFLCIDCTGNPSPPYTVYHHVGYLYVLWGVPLGWLLIQAVRVLLVRVGSPVPVAGSPEQPADHPEDD
jgi:hypothetical protein